MNMNDKTTKNHIKRNEGRDEIIALSRVHSKTCYFICFISKVLNYFINVIGFVHEKVLNMYSSTEKDNGTKMTIFCSRIWVKI